VSVTVVIDLDLRLTWDVLVLNYGITLLLLQYEPAFLVRNGEQVFSIGAAELEHVHGRPLPFSGINDTQVKYLGVLLGRELVPDA
jgi:hypothetical protein